MITENDSQEPRVPTQETGETASLAALVERVYIVGMILIAALEVVIAAAWVACVVDELVGRAEEPAPAAAQEVAHTEGHTICNTCKQVIDGVTAEHAEE